MQLCQVPHIVMEDGLASRIGEQLSARFDVQRVLLITDKDLLALGLVAPAEASLREAGYGVDIYTDVSPDPPDRQVLAAAHAGKAAGAELVIGYGGGSVMDVAKVSAALIAGEQQLEDMYGVDRVRGRRLPLVQVPTTAGTGSEVTNVAVITTGATTKSGIVSPVLYADMALLDPKLTLGLPRAATAATGIDAMVHAIEAITSKRLKNPVSDMLAVAALKHLSRALVPACTDGGNLEARRDMLLGAMMAGQAFSNAPVAAVHALAYPLGGHFHLSHGLSNALVLPHVLKFNADMAAPLYGELGTAMGLSGGCEKSCCFAFLDWLEDLAVRTGVERRLRDVGIVEDDVALLAREAMKQDRLLINNPKPLTEGDARAIYEAAW